MNGTCPQIWSVQMHASHSTLCPVVNISLHEAQGLLSAEGDSLPDLQSWRYEFVICGSLHEYPQKTYDSLTGCFKCIMPHKIGSRDTIEFNFHVDLEQGFASESNKQTSRTYSVTDNIFNIYWTYHPNSRTVRGLILYTTNEAASQVSHVLKKLPKYHKYRSWPLLPALMGLQAEILAMRPRLDYQSSVITTLQAQTGYHDYGDHLSNSHNSAIDLVRVSKSAGVAMANAITNSFWLLCMTQLARFLSDETDSLTALDNQPQVLQAVVEGAPPRAEWLDIAPQLKEHITSWHRSCGALLREAEVWKQRATLLVQALSILAFQRGRG